MQGGSVYKGGRERISGIFAVVVVLSVAIAVVLSAGCGRGPGSDQGSGANDDPKDRAREATDERTVVSGGGDPAVTTASRGPTTMLMAASAEAFVAVDASPQPSGEVHVASDLAADRRGRPVAPTPPEYEVTKNGTLIIGGDVLIECGDLARLKRESPAPRTAGKAVRAAMERSFREQVAACRAAGFPPKNR